MISKKKAVEKTYSTSWMLGLFIAVIVGLIGLLLVGTNPSWNIPLWEGFLSGFVLTLVVQLITLACIIPFAGLYLYWMWANEFCDWFLRITHLQSLDVIRWIPLVVCGIFGAIIFILFTILAIGLILRLLSSH
jgi:hypothetical protein